MNLILTQVAGCNIMLFQSPDGDSKWTRHEQVIAKWNVIIMAVEINNYLIDYSVKFFNHLEII